MKLLNALIFPIAMYGRETWVMKKGDRRRKTCFEISCYRKALRISWVEHMRNDEIIRRSGCRNRLMQTLVGRRLSYVGHVMRSDTLERELLMGVVRGGEEGQGQGYWIT